MASAFIEHLKSFMGCKDVSVDPAIPFSLFTRKLSLSDALHMIRPITDTEIKTAMFQIGNNKTPGSDGFSSKFLRPHGM